MASSSLVARGGIPKETIQFTWRITDFEQVRNCKQLLESMRVGLEIGSKIGFPVKLKAVLSYIEKDGKKWVGLFFHVVDRPKDASVMMSAKLKIGNYRNASFERYVFPAPEKSGYGWNNIIAHDESASKLPLDADGSLAFDLEVTLYKVSSDAEVLTWVTAAPPSVSSVLGNFERTFLNNLAKDLGKLLHEEGVSPSPGAPSLIRVISKDGKELTANSSILAARSPVFCSMFQTPMTEVKEGVIRLDDINGEALEVFLDFVHTATLSEKWKEDGVVAELAYAAHKYLLQDLLQFLDEALGLISTAENCVELVRVAKRLELKKAEKALLVNFREQWKEAANVEEMMVLWDNSGL